MDVPGDEASLPQLPEPSAASTPADAVQVAPVAEAAASATSPSPATTSVVMSGQDGDAAGADSAAGADGDAAGDAAGADAGTATDAGTASGAAASASPPAATSSDVASGGASSSSAAPAAAGADVAVYQVNVKCIDSTTTQLEVPSDLSGADLKELIAERLEAPVDRQRLIFRGRVVKDDDTVGHHITESGQTLHMVQRPPPADGAQADAPGGASQGASEAGNNIQMHGAPHVHFQFTTNDPNGMPQVDLSQLLSSAGLGALGRGGGISMVQSTAGGVTGPRGMQPQIQGAQPGGSSSAPASASSAVPQTPGAGAAGESQNPLEQLHQQIFGGLMQAQANGQPMPPGAMTTGPDGGGFTAVGPSLVNMPPGFVAAPPTPGLPAGQTMMAGQPQNIPMQIVFQQGMGNLAQMLPMMLGETFQMADHVTLHGGMGGDGGQGPPEGQAAVGSGQLQDAALSGDTLPWRDLRRLHQHLSRLLGRSSRSRTIPPTHMPGGELNAFLSMLLAAISQLGVAVSDLQASFLDDEGPQPRYRLQLAMALIAAARALRGMATALQSGQLRGNDETRPAPAPLEEAPTTTQAEAEAAAQTSPLVYSSESEAAGELGGMMEVAAPPLRGDAPAEIGEMVEMAGEMVEMAEVFLDPIPGVTQGGSQTVITGSGGDLAANDLHMAEMVQQLFGQVVSQQAFNATSSATSEGSAAPVPPDLATVEQQIIQDRPPAAEQPTPGQQATSAPGLPAGLASMPPEVAACWQRWTQTDNFRPVLAQAVQAPFSHAYSSGDTVGSRRSPTELPEPEEFLPVRWERTASRVEDLDDVPEPPEHLSRAYLCAFLRDLGRFAEGNATFQSMPEERFPHLTRYARFFAQDQPSAGADSSGGGASAAA